MKIGILSDSHRRPELTKSVIELFKDNNVSYLLHAGDLEIEENLKILKNSSIPYVCVFGNNDQSLYSLAGQYNIYQEPYYFKIKKEIFKLMHLPYFMSPDANIIISGHTHNFEQSYNNKTLYINPGEACARDKSISECAILEIKQNQYIITYYYKELNKTNPIWETKEFNHER